MVIAVETIERMCQHFAVQPQELFEYVPNPPDSQKKKIASSQNKNRLARAVLLLLGNNPTNLLLLGIYVVLTTYEERRRIIRVIQGYCLVVRCSSPFDCGGKGNPVLAFPADQYHYCKSCRRGICAGASRGPIHQANSQMAGTGAGHPTENGSLIGSSPV
jgi:hypothetical protein